MDPEQTDGEWLGLAAAAATLGVSTRTLSRRLADNQYAVSTGAKGKKLILVPCAAKTSSTRADVADVPATVEAKSLGRMVDLVSTTVIADLRRSRRWSVAGWALAVLLLAAVGGSAMLNMRLWGDVDKATAITAITKQESARLMQMQQAAAQMHQVAADRAERLDVQLQAERSRAGALVESNADMRVQLIELQATIAAAQNEQALIEAAQLSKLGR